jgi:hypothetical protein
MAEGESLLASSATISRAARSSIMRLTFKENELVRNRRVRPPLDDRHGPRAPGVDRVMLAPPSVAETIRSACRTE